jgi:hypothetical protein
MIIIMVDAMIRDSTVTAIPMMVTGTVDMMVYSTEITGITTVIMEEMVIVMDCGEDSKILEVIS